MKQTAVEWLVEQLSDEFSNYPDAIIEQAKAMEKKYLEQFYNQGYTQCSIEDLKPTSRDRFVDAKDYYNKTFKSESFCNCPKGKGIDFDENQKAYCIDCGKNINL